jgi:regulator of replication initiation timing
MNETIKIMDKQQLFEQISGFYQTLEELESQTIQMMVERDVLNEKIYENFDMELEDLESETIQMMVERDVLNEKIYENKEQIESLEKLKLNK